MSTYRKRYAAPTTRKHTAQSSYPALLYLHMCFCPQDGWTALHLAAQEGKVDVVRLLTEAEAHINMQIEVHTCICMYKECCCYYVSGHVYGTLCTLLTLDECHVVSWSDKCTYDCVHTGWLDCSLHCLQGRTWTSC